MIYTDNVNQFSQFKLKISKSKNQSTWLLLIKLISNQVWCRPLSHRHYLSLALSPGLSPHSAALPQQPLPFMTLRRSVWESRPGPPERYSGDTYSKSSASGCMWTWMCLRTSVFHPGNWSVGSAGLRWPCGQSHHPCHCSGWPSYRKGRGLSSCPGIPRDWYLRPLRVKTRDETVLDPFYATWNNANLKQCGVLKLSTTSCFLHKMWNDMKKYYPI